MHGLSAVPTGAELTLRETEMFGVVVPLEAVTRLPAGRRLLLVLDNFEQLLDAAPIGEGRTLSIDEAVAIAADSRPQDGDPDWLALTPREREVAALVAAGLANREVGTRLFLSVRTVEVHVDHVLGKLGFNRRSQLAAWFHERGRRASTPRSEVRRTVGSPSDPPDLMGARAFPEAVARRRAGLRGRE